MSLFGGFRRQSPDAGSLAAQAPDGDESSAPDDEAHIPGERGESVVQRPPSLQARVTNVLAVALAGTLALGLLGWYYVHSIGARANARAAAQSSAQEKAKAEMALRPLGRVDPPPPVASLPTPQPHSTLETLLGEPPEEPAPNIQQAWSQPVGNPAPSAAVAGSPSVKTPEQLQLERQLTGPVFTGNTALGAVVPEVGERANASAGDLHDLLRPSVTPAVSAQVLPTQRLLLPKGAFLDCTLETAIDSSLPGMTTCVIATDTFSADGSVVLLARGTKLVGETRGQVRAGTARIFVLWTEARTPEGIVVPLASPGTDELGRAGLPGEVNRHFFERFGAAILVSVIDGAVQVAVESQREDGGTVVVSPSRSSDIMTEVLKSTINIPPTVTKPQGDRIQVFVARDLDFRSVYELRPIAGAR